MPRILIVDDDPDYRHMVRHMLQSRGIDAEAVEGAFGLSARLLNEPRIDLVLLDCMMPGLTGAGVLGVLAKNARVASIPVLLLSAATNAEAIAAAAQHPRCRFAHKPARLRDLLAMVEAALTELS